MVCAVEQSSTRKEILLIVYVFVLSPLVSEVRKIREMPGYRVTTVEQVKGGVICPHCKLVLRDAVQTVEEGHRLCESCYKEICLEPNRMCSDCEISIGEDEQIYPDRAVRRDIQNLLVKCEYHVYGCPWTGKLKDLEDHCHVCRYQPVQCPNEGCSEVLPRETMDQHIDEECLFRKSSCEYCGEECRVNQLEEHYTTCPRIPVICDRCKTNVPREKLEDHQFNDCPVVVCLGCDKMLKRSVSVVAKSEAELESTEEHLQDPIELESTEEHLRDPIELFNHMHKLAWLTKITYNKLKTVEKQHSHLLATAQKDTVTSAEIATIHEEIQKSRKALGVRISLLERTVEAVQKGRDKNAGTKLEDMNTKVQHQNDRILQLEQIVKRLQTQYDTQSKTMHQIQQQHTTYSGWNAMKYTEGSHGFESGSETRFLQLERKIEEIERQTAMMKVHVSELELQLQASLASTHNGAFLWRIPEVSRRKRDAIDERITSIYSPPFYTGRNGYKMCIRAYLNGDGIGYQSHLSVFFVLMKGEFDPLLKWPFDYKVSLILVDQNHRKHIVQTFKPTPESSSFQRPRSDMNVASGCPQFAKLSVLDDDSYVKEDVLYLKCIVDVSRIFHP